MADVGLEAMAKYRRRALEAMAKYKAAVATEEEENRNLNSSPTMNISTPGHAAGGEMGQEPSIALLPWSPAPPRPLAPRSPPKAAHHVDVVGGDAGIGTTRASPSVSAEAIEESLAVLTETIGLSPSSALTLRSGGGGGCTSDGAPSLVALQEQLMRKVADAKARLDALDAEHAAAATTIAAGGARSSRARRRSRGGEGRGGSSRPCC